MCIFILSHCKEKWGSSLWANKIKIKFKKIEVMWSRNKDSKGGHTQVHWIKKKKQKTTSGDLIQGFRFKLLMSRIITEIIGPGLGCDNGTFYLGQSRNIS